jgi:hypothetical protein
MGFEACNRLPDGSPSCQYKSLASQELCQSWQQENPNTTIFGHQEVNSRASSSSSAHMASSSEPSRKRVGMDPDTNSNIIFLPFFFDFS